MSLRKTPLAWHNLTHDWRRLSMAIAGVCFAILLMFVQRGFQHALFDSQVKIIDDLNPELADIIILSKARYALPTGLRFPLVRLQQASSTPGVQAAYPLYLESEVSLLKKAGHFSHPIRVIGVDLEASLFQNEAIGRSVTDLQSPDTAIIDIDSKRTKFPFSLDQPLMLKEEEAQLAGRPVQLVGSFSLGRDFATTEGNLLMSDRNFAAYFPFRAAGSDPLSVVDVGVVQLEEGFDPAEVVASLEQEYKHTNDVVVLTREDFRQREVRFWDRATPIGIIFITGTILGFVVGMIICYQIIYSDIADHLAEFATLKAMGYTKGYFIRLIVRQSIYLSLLGFIPGVLLSWGVFQVVSASAGLMMSMTPLHRVALVLVLTMVMCISSGLLALRKLEAFDPADLF